VFQNIALLLYLEESVWNFLSQGYEGIVVIAGVKPVFELFVRFLLVQMHIIPLHLELGQFGQRLVSLGLDGILVFLLFVAVLEGVQLLGQIG